jgi:hypothetical protein
MLRGMTDVDAVSVDGEAPVETGRRWGPLLVAGLVGLVLGAGGVGAVWAVSTSGPGDPGAFTLRGTLTLTGDNVPTDDGEGCVGYEGYDDIVAGAAVTVTDEDGKVVGSGALGAGRPNDDDSSCVFGVRVPDVPRGSKFYKVEVSHRGGLTVTAKEAEAGGFAATLG